MSSPPEAPASDVHALAEHVFRHHAGRLHAVLLRIFGTSALEWIEDVVQDTFVQALRHWPYRGVPDSPEAWLTQVAKRRALDRLRRGHCSQSKQAELTALTHALLGESWELEAPTFTAEINDHVLRLIFGCCSATLSRDSQVAVTLRLVGGRSIEEIARAFLVTPSAMARRVQRAKNQIRASGPMDIPGPDDLATQRTAVLEVIYLMFNEGHSPTQGGLVSDRDLCAESLRLARLVADHETVGSPDADALVALICFVLARLDARHSGIDTLQEQDRRSWDPGLIRLGVKYLGRSARGTVISSYHLQAEIASCHTLAKTWEDTDWQRILDRYDALYRLDGSPVVWIHRCVALAEVLGAASALKALKHLAPEERLRNYVPYLMVQADLLRRLERRSEAHEAYARAEKLSSNAAVQEFCQRKQLTLADAH
ncbi:MAG: sigma-70 family RNA polymerase sigma factor [Myxococcota bacterium]